jgi:hypothetical protein
VTFFSAEERQKKACLITSRQIGVEVVLPVKRRHVVDPTSKSQGSFDSSFNTATIQNRQSAGSGSVKKRNLRTQLKSF